MNRVIRGRRSRFFLLSTLLLATQFMATDSHAEEVLNRFQRREYRSGEARLLYCLLQPKEFGATAGKQDSTARGKASHDRSKTYPLVLFFHGAGERGDDNQKQLIHGMSDFASDEIMAKYPCFVVAPQCPDELQWVDTPWTAERHTMPAQPTEPLRMSLALVAALQREFPIDERRIYLTGLSMGGFGVWDALQRYPNRFAAAVPICGGGDEALAERIKNVAIWAFHGDSDPVVKPQRTRAMIAALQAAGGTPRYTEYANTGHNSWTATYANRKLYEWLFSQRRTE